MGFCIFGREENQESTVLLGSDCYMGTTMMDHGLKGCLRISTWFYDLNMDYIIQIVTTHVAAR